MTAVILWYYELLHIIEFSVQDVDGDDVRCRWAVGNECGGVCQTFPASLSMVNRVW